ncbi:oxidoreductase [Glaesserella parasuis]|uniref:Aspartate-semialdehyde dehydrogenase n=1 Tax=Glaesserella parasuis ZJ0906 TaxID=1322346 RepID=A0A806JCG2_GLAPU|nr:oxidoreductase [Glaesserella parasuis]AGO16451.1 aspartate-semialdehyde dehydrogenase [Glaesserella parasuis ZJ0906]ATW45777.1 aspartate-semialdehyde dehydrogenase [Glaesserella parasuis str. Nagasaki]EQA04091.1 semialdehyde dehydrogenase, dimerization domain protein [Glaesserella parasuis str. Nagasaki]EYE71693.1 aspartate-semialdehyde dehydrogenase [Glaesserella parasuis str. Nagasaki]MDD2162897.1 oxidoreductase [Glaesserella parasuis]
MANIRLAIAADFLLAEKLLEALEQSSLDFEQISAVELESFGEEHSLRFGAKAVEQIAVEDVNWSQFSHVLFAGKMANAELLAQAVQAGCVILDLYGISALIGNVPVIVPSVNNEMIANVRERNIVALANPQISQLALALKPLLDQPIQHIFVTSLLPSAYFGDEKVRELAGQTAQLLNGIPLDDEKPRVAFDAVPANVQGDEKHLSFSRAFELQLAKVLPNLTASVTFHSVQVPVFYGISQMISVQSEYALDATALSEQWQQQAWVKFNSDNVVTPVKNGEDEEVNLLQISQLLNKNENALQFWAVADEQRFSLAFLAVELLKEVITSY